MKTKSFSARQPHDAITPSLHYSVLLGLCSLLLAPGALLAQGPLTPPGAPAPLFKTLQQIEPRTPISSLPFSITNAGSYYLTTNLSGSASLGIVIGASGVTLDLMGFELVGGGLGSGILVAGARTNVTIRNGTVLGWSGAGVSAQLTVNCHLKDLRVSNCGGDGIAVGDYPVISGCTVSFNSGNGLVTGAGSRVLDSIARNNGADGIQTGAGSTVSGCTVSFNSGFNTGTGILAGTGSRVLDSAAYGNDQDGIRTGDGSSVSGCTAIGNTDYGISAGYGNTIIGCSAISNSVGISTGVGSTASDCAAHRNTSFGIVTGTGCTVSGCTSYENGDDGINAFDGCTVSGCTASRNTGHGIYVQYDCRVVNNTCDANGTGGDAAGIYAFGNSNRIDGNNVIGNDRGIDVDGSVNFIIRNSARGNSSNYEIVTGNRVGTIVVPPVSGVITGNGPGAGSGATDPFANFAF